MTLGKTSLIAIVLILFLQLSNQSEAYTPTIRSWDSPNVIMQFVKPVCIKAHIFVSQQLYSPDRVVVEEDYAKKVAFETQRIFSWHNVKFDIVNITEFKKGDPFPVGETLSKTLSAFKAWLRKNYQGDDMHILLVDFESDESAVGLAAMRSVCTQNAAAVVQTGERVGFDVKKNAQAMAHEMGHILGLEHVSADTPDCLCEDASGYKCVMYDTTYGWSKETPTAFHSCSIKKIMDNTPMCLRICKSGDNSLHKCGNGIVDVGEDVDEECDCGFEQSCILRGADSCCDHTNCKLKGSSTECAEGECCKDCKFTVGEQCGFYIGECDLPDFCAGKTADCPVNNMRPAGFECEDGKGHCYYGTCSTPDNGCKRLFPNSKMKYSKECKDILNKAAEDDCKDGLKNEDLEFAVCTSGSVFCGQLWCEAEGEVNDPYYRLTVNGRACYTVLEPENRLTKMPSATPCDENKYCVGYRCENDNFYQFDCPEECEEYTACGHLSQCVPVDSRYFGSLPEPSN